MIFNDLEKQMISEENERLKKEINRLNDALYLFQFAEQLFEKQLCLINISSCSGERQYQKMMSDNPFFNIVWWDPVIEFGDYFRIGFWKHMVFVEFKKEVENCKQKTNAKSV